jgi:hypothetical protein
MRNKYYKLASQRFLAGTQFKTPCDAVEAGAKTLLEWTQVLEEERHQSLLVQQHITRQGQQTSVSREVHTRF